MKKGNLYAGFLMLLAGIGFLLAALLLDTRLGSLFAGFCGAFGAGGAVQLYKYWKWTSPKHAAEYRERLEQEKIDLRDERKEMLRNKSGRYAYILGLLVGVAGIMVFVVLELLEVVSASAGRLMVLVLAGYTLFQYLAGIVIYRLLSRKY